MRLHWPRPKPVLDRCPWCHSTSGTAHLNVRDFARVPFADFVRMSGAQAEAEAALAAFRVQPVDPR